MSTTTDTASQAPTGPRRRLFLASALVLVVLGAIALNTKVVRVGSEEDTRKQAFSPEAFGAAEFPKVKTNLEKRAVDATELAAAIAADKDGTVAKYGVPSGTGPVFPVRLTGVVGEGKSGVYTVKVEGLPAELRVRVQTGPAINGTELRDATGTIEFGQFTNQIEYQDAGSALNNEMKRQVLAAIDNTALGGKTISVVGAFRLVNPKSWLVAPVRLDVQ